MTAEPKYRRIVNELRRQIDTGELLPEQRIPSTAQLCEMFGCSQTAVNTAVLLLAQDNYIVGTPGLGRFVKPL